MRTMWIGRVVLVGWILAGVSVGSVLAQGDHGQGNRDAIDRMRDLNLQPERVMDAIKLDAGMVVGEAGASYGYFTFKMSKRVGPTGRVYANDIDRAALQVLDRRSKAQQIANISTVLGAVDDPLFPRTDLEMIVVFDCLFEFSEPAKWIAQTQKYLKPGGRLVIVDPDPSKLGSSPHFLSRAKIHEFARKSGYAVVAVDDSFLRSHMIVVLEPKPPRQAR